MPTTSRRRTVFITGLTMLGGSVLACGLSVTGSDEPASGSSPATPGGSTSATAPAPEPLEPRVTTFVCGAATCNTGVDVCCEEAAGTFVCRSLEAGGCPAPADGGVAKPSLLCTTYTGCPSGTDCCYSTGGGSSCKTRCDQGEVELCRVGVDGCGQNRDCVKMNNPPAPNVGECKFSVGGGTSNGGSSFGSSFGGTSNGSSNGGR